MKLGAGFALLLAMVALVPFSVAMDRPGDRDGYGGGGYGGGYNDDQGSDYGSGYSSSESYSRGGAGGTSYGRDAGYSRVGPRPQYGGTPGRPSVDDLRAQLSLSRINTRPDASPGNPRGSSYQSGSQTARLSAPAGSRPPSQALVPQEPYYGRSPQSRGMQLVPAEQRYPGGMDSYYPGHGYGADGAIGPAALGVSEDSYFRGDRADLPPIGSDQSWIPVVHSDVESTSQAFFRTHMAGPFHQALSDFHGIPTLESDSFPKKYDDPNVAKSLRAVTSDLDAAIQTIYDEGHGETLQSWKSIKHFAKSKLPKEARPYATQKAEKAEAAAGKGMQLLKQVRKMVRNLGKSEEYFDRAYKFPQHDEDPPKTIMDRYFAELSGLRQAILKHEGELVDLQTQADEVKDLATKRLWRA